MKKFLILLCIFGLCGCGRSAEPVSPDSGDLFSSDTAAVSAPIRSEETTADPDPASRTAAPTSEIISQPPQMTTEPAPTSETASQLSQTTTEPVPTSEIPSQPPKTTAADRTETGSESRLPQIETSAEIVRSSVTSISTSALAASETTSASTEEPSLPTETVSAEALQPDAENFCTISIECSTVLDNWSDLEKGKEEIVPKDGIILPPIAAGFSEGESVFDVLQRVCRENKIHMESSWTPMYNSAYIEGIHNLYEFDCGSGSGWMYRVNGDYPNYGCSSCILRNGDVVEWRYTCDLGKDIGGDVLG